MRNYRSRLRDTMELDRQERNEIAKKGRQKLRDEHELKVYTDKKKAALLNRLGHRRNLYPGKPKLSESPKNSQPNIRSRN